MEWIKLYILDFHNMNRTPQLRFATKNLPLDQKETACFLLCQSIEWIESQLAYFHINRELKKPDLFVSIYTVYLAWNWQQM